MKIFHLSDLHIGKQLHRYNMSEEQRAVFQQITNAVKKEMPQAVILAGDIYDSPVPSAEAVSIFDEFLTALSRVEPQPAVLLIAGNHDSARRLDFASSILTKHKIHIAGMPPMQPEEHLKRVTLSDEWGKVDFYLLPFVKPSYVRNVFEEEITGYDMAVRKLIEREVISTERRNVIVSHQFYTAGGSEPQTCDSEVRLVGGIENVDVSALEIFDYAALGHIHRSQKMGRQEVRYCGTPLPYSVSEAEDKKSITIVEIGEKGKKPKIRTLPLMPSRGVQKLTGRLEEIISMTGEENRHDFVSITLTDEIEPYQLRERLEECFDHILEIRIDNARTRKILEFSDEGMEKSDPYEAFCQFFEEINSRNMTEQEAAIMRQVLNQEIEGVTE